MGLLDYAEEAKNKLRGLLGDMPISHLVRGDYEMPTVNGLRNALLGMPKPFNPNDASANEAAMAFWNPAGLLGKIVYHGSPHKFDKFDASKIGTGEGAQAYGHGTYLADSEGVAREYQHTLSGRKDIDRSRAYANAQIAKKYADKWEAMLKDPSIPRPLSAATRRPVTDEYLKRQIEDELAESARHTKWIEESNPGGSLYKADLPDEWIPKMLDWDNSIPEATRQAISKPMIEKFGSGASGGMGLNQWKQVVWEFKNAGSKQPEIDAANFLREQGIPGIRYLDGGSRGKGQGSYNYVVFPGLEDQVKILERNGVPVNGLLGGK